MQGQLVRTVPGMDTGMEQRKLAFAKRFNAALERSGKAELSDGELVKRLARKGVVATSQTVSNWRNGKHFPKFEQIEGIARMLDTDPGDLAFGKARVAEPHAVWASGESADQAMVEELALLDEQEREALWTLIRLLRPRGSRPGRRKQARRD